MTFRGITAANDWTFGQGKATYLTKDRAIMADVKTALLFYLNDCFFALDQGIDWSNLLGSKQPLAQVNVLLQTRSTIVARYGVVRINSVTAQVDAALRRITVTYNLDSIFTRSIAGSVTA